MSAQDDAKKLVDDFENRTTTYWITLDRAKIAAGLRDRIDDPDHINQGGTSLCGPADFIRDIAEDKPVDYARAVIELYENGKTRIGTMDLKPCHDLRAHRVPAVQGSRMSTGSFSPVFAIPTTGGSITNQKTTMLLLSQCPTARRSG